MTVTKVANVVKAVSDPYSSSTLSESAGVNALSLRDADWSEAGPDLFFVGVNGVVALFAACVWISGVLPSVMLDLDTLSVTRIFGVNWAIMAISYGGYHWAFFNGGYLWLCGNLPTKFNPAPLDPGQLAREVTLTSFSMGIASCYTALAWWGINQGWWLRGELPSVTTSSITAAAANNNMTEILIFSLKFLLLSFWSDFHFYCVHRLLHIPFLFRSVHRVHHLSKNPGPWSGLSMHPIETTIYLSKVLLPLAFPSHSMHPIHFLFLLYNATLMPIPGHSGHLELLGNEYHWIHHHTYLHNYGSPAVPLDKFFGSHKLLPKNKAQKAL